jgi:hypothetical protein
MKKLGFVYLGLLSLSCFAFKTSSKEKYLEVFIMSSFENDSIRLKTTVSNDKSFKATTSPSLGQATSLFLKMSKTDTTIYIYDLVNRTSDSIKFQPMYRYLYIFYQRPKFSFEYSLKPLLLE